MKTPRLRGFSSISANSRTAGTAIFGAKLVAIAAAVWFMGLPAAAADDGWSRSEAGIDLSIATALSDPQLAQFAIKKAGPGAPPVLPRVLPISYTYGAEFEMPYYRNRDLNSDLQDDTLLAAPTVFASITYRPYNWLELMIEGTLEKLISVREEETITLPDGSLQQRDPKPWSLLLDQVFAKFSIPETPVDVTVGRRGFLDPRLWVYDGESDGVIVTLRPTDWTIEASVTRQEGLDLDLATHIPRGYTNDYILKTQYRGLADHNIEGYVVVRDHPPSAGEGRPQHFILQATGRPSNAFSYWAQFGYVDGRDENGLKLDAYAADVGGTYRFLNVPLQPSVTVHLAYGSGDPDANDQENNQYRQTGLGSNEGRYGGVTQFLYYGEALNPELSNLQIYTIGGSIRPAPQIFLDLVYHHYRLNEIANEIRGQEFTTTMNDNAFGQSKSVGHGVDIAIGFRRIFGITRLGSEIRAGVFFPGDAWDSSARSDKAISILGVIFI